MGLGMSINCQYCTLLVWLMNTIFCARTPFYNDDDDSFIQYTAYCSHEKGWAGSIRPRQGSPHRAKNKDRTLKIKVTKQKLTSTD